MYDDRFFIQYEKLIRLHKYVFVEFINNQPMFFCVDSEEDKEKARNIAMLMWIAML